jgi:hypothetical protein
MKLFYKKVELNEDGRYFNLAGTYASSDPYSKVEHHEKLSRISATDFWRV